MDTRDTTGGGAALRPDIVEGLVRMQQVLHDAGYRPVAGDPDTWPLSDVLLERDHRYLYLAAWEPDRQLALRHAWQHFVQQDGDAGLLLVGADPIADRALTDLFVATPGLIAYLDCTTGKVRFSNDVAVMQDLPELFRAQPLIELWQRAQATTADTQLLREAVRTAHSATPNSRPDTHEGAPAFRPWLTYTLLAACVLLYLGMLLAGSRGMLTPRVEVLREWGALDGQRIAAGEWWRMLSNAFLHASPMHIFFNMWAAMAFIPMLEAWQGRRRVLALYVFSALTSSVLSLWWLPRVLSVGASGALFGMLGVAVALLVRYRKDFPSQFRAQFFNWLKSILVMNLLISFVPGINYAGHLGGFIGGFLLGSIIGTSPFSAPARLSRRALAAASALVLLTLGLGYLAMMRIAAMG